VGRHLPTRRDRTQAIYTLAHQLRSRGWKDAPHVITLRLTCSGPQQFIAQHGKCRVISPAASYQGNSRKTKERCNIVMGLGSSSERGRWLKRLKSDQRLKTMLIQHLAVFRASIWTDARKSHAVELSMAVSNPWRADGCG
jgi:hypothetical protein